MNIRQVRNKIKSIGNVKKVTKAMEMVSAIKMRKAQQAAIDGGPYQTKLNEVINRLVGRVDLSLSSLLSTKTISKKKLMLIVSTNKGLCGGFNFNLFRMVNREIDFSQTDFVTVGKKGSYFVSKMGAKVVADYSQGSFQTEVSAIFDFILTGFMKGEYREIYLVYNQFISALKQEPVIEKLLPFQIESDQIKEKNEEYLVEPSAIEVVDALLRSYLEQRIRYAFIQSEAGEHSARMIAMKNATDNADELTYSLTMLRNKLRQQKITYELLDMVTAKESVEN